MVVDGQYRKMWWFWMIVLLTGTVACRITETIPCLDHLRRLKIESYPNRRLTNPLSSPFPVDISCHLNIWSPTFKPEHHSDSCPFVTSKLADSSSRWSRSRAISHHPFRHFSVKPRRFHGQSRGRHIWNTHLPQTVFPEVPMAKEWKKHETCWVRMRFNTQKNREC